MLSLLLLALAQPVSAEPLEVDEVVLCCTDDLPPLPIPEIPVLSVVPRQPDLPPELLLPTQAFSAAQQRLQDWQALRADPPADPKALLERLEALGATVDLRLYRRAARRGWDDVLRVYLDEEVAAQRTRLQSAEDARLDAFRQPSADPPVDVWRLFVLATLQPDLRAEIANVLRTEHPDGPHLDRILYLNGVTHPDQQQDLEALLARFPDTTLAASAHAHLARAALLRDDPTAALQHAEAAEGPIAGLLAAQARLRLADISDAWKLILDLQSAPSAELDATTARALIEVSRQQDAHALELARQHDLSRPEMLAALADDLVSQGRLDEAVLVIRALLWTPAPDAPQRHQQLARLYTQLGEAEQAAQVRQDMIERYRPDGSWVHRFRDNPEVVAVGLEVREEVVRSVALEWHQRAQLSGEADDYANAARTYKSLSDASPQDRWLLADALIGSGQDASARAALEALVAENGGYARAAQYRLVSLYTPGAEERDEEDIQEAALLPSGKTRTVLNLNEDAQALVDVVDALGGKGPPPSADVESYDGVINDALPALYHLAGEVFFLHGHLEAARVRHLRLIEQYPHTEEAGYAALRILEGYSVEEDLAAVEEWGLRFAQMQLGAGERSHESARRAAEMAEYAAFQQAQQLSEAGDRAAQRAAAEAFLRFCDRYPTSEHAATALLNAAVHLESAGEPDRALGLFEAFVEQYPDHERVLPLMFRIASHYASLLELERAIRWYEQLAYHGPEYIDAPSALYNAGFLRALLGDHLGAAKAWERYVQHFPQQRDAEAVMFAAGRQWLLVDDDQAKAFFQRYIHLFRDENPDHLIEAHHTLCRLQQEPRCPELLRAYDQIEGQAGPAARHLAAMTAFSTLDGETDPAVLRDVGLPQIERFQDLSHSVAVLYTIGSAEMDAGNRAAGEAMLQKALALGKAENHWSPWLDRIEERLGIAPPPLLTLPTFLSDETEEGAWAAARARLRAEHSDPAAEVGLTAFYLSQGDTARAVLLAQSARYRTADAEHNPLVIAAVAEALRQNGDPAAARAALEPVLLSPVARSVLAQLRLDAHDWTGALEATEGLSEAPAVLARGIALHRLDRLAEAEAAYRAASSAAPDAAAPHHNLAVLFEQQGRDAEAAAARAAADARQ